MIDNFTILHRGGLVLWSRSLNDELSIDSSNSSSNDSSPIQELITQELFSEQRQINSSDSSSSIISSKCASFNYNKYTLYYTFNNELNLIFVIIYLKSLSNKLSLYIDNLLFKLMNSFIKNHRDSIIKQSDSINFDKKYDDIIRSFETNNNSTINSSIIPSKAIQQKSNQNDHNKIQQQSIDSNESNGSSETNGKSNVNASSELTGSAALLATSIPRRLAGPRKMNHGPPKKKGNSVVVSSSDPNDNKSSQKQGRTWNNKTSAKEAAALDYSQKYVDNENSSISDQSKDDEEARRQAYLDEYLPDKRPLTKHDFELKQNQNDHDSDDENDDDEISNSNSKSSKGLFGFFNKLVGRTSLSEDDLKPVLEELKTQLMQRNVAYNITMQLCSSVSASLIGRPLKSFTSVKSVVKSAMVDALTRILTPEVETDILLGIQTAKQSKRPYSVVFLGVNGVGKSTSLAKTAAYFGSLGLKVGLVACDTFRAGAIEQLRTHASCLQIPLFAKGYDRDAAQVAVEGIASAKKDGLDVVLIDTAGRMQDNTPLMKSLSKLIDSTRPDLILFVGEALVGNDAVDQAAKFNRCLSDLSNSNLPPRLIDGIVLTKFDTIDDRVGAAISMAYTTKRPILFVGVGQTYKDLKRMNVKTLINALLK